MFKDKKCNYTILHGSGVGYSQNDVSVPNGWKIDLSKEDWFVFEDNFGTSEEKAFVAYFKTFVPRLKAKYDKVFLVRNERQLHIYSFKGGERFEPDYLLFLHKQNEAGYQNEKCRACIDFLTVQASIQPWKNHFRKTKKLIDYMGVNPRHLIYGDANFDAKK